MLLEKVFNYIKSSPNKIDSVELLNDLVESSLYILSRFNDCKVLDLNDIWILRHLSKILWRISEILVLVSSEPISDMDISFCALTTQQKNNFASCIARNVYIIFVSLKYALSTSTSDRLEVISAIKDLYVGFYNFTKIYNISMEYLFNQINDEYLKYEGEQVESVI